MKEIKDQDSEGMKHQEDPLPTGMKIFFLVTVILVEILDTIQSIVESMKETPMQETWMVVDMEMLVDLSTKVIIHFPH